MSNDIMSFHVRIILPKNQIKLIISLGDLNLRVNHFAEDILRDLKKSGNKEFAEELEHLLHFKYMVCWDRKVPITTKFINLNSKVEKIDGKEADVFELEFSN